MSADASMATTPQETKAELTKTVIAPAPVDAEMGEAPKADRELSDRERAAVRQIEFYFADSNLPYDKFMWTLHTANEGHWVPISTVSSFKRMREYESEGKEWLVKALRYSSELEVDKEGVNVRRRHEVKEPKDAMARSVYAKGFGEERSNTQKALEEFFARYGNVNVVRMRRDDDKKWKGSVFCEFTDSATVDKFLKADPKPEWEGNELVIMTKDAYVEMKIKEKGLTGKAIKRDNFNGGHRTFDAFREMKKTDAKTKPAEKEVILEFMGTRLPIKGTNASEARVEEDEVPRINHTTLRFAGCGGECPFDDVKGPLKERYARLPFIKYERGEDSGLVGFDRALTNEDIEFVRGAVKTINGKSVTWDFIDEETERTFTIERAQAAARRVYQFVVMKQSEPREGGGRGRGHGRGGRGGTRGGGRGRGGRGGGRGGSRNAEKSNGTTAITATPSGEEGTGEKRKRAVEPDGGFDVGQRNTGVPTIASSKKPRTEDTAS